MMIATTVKKIRGDQEKKDMQYPPLDINFKYCINRLLHVYKFNV